MKRKIINSIYKDILTQTIPIGLRDVFYNIPLKKKLEAIKKYSQCNYEMYCIICNENIGHDEGWKEFELFLYEKIGLMSL